MMRYIMKKKTVVALILILACIIGIAGFWSAKILFTPKKVHYHAGFVVLAHNTKVDFSDWKYMTVRPCSLTKKDDGSNKVIQNEKAHLHDGVGDVVHVERAGGTWQDLFKNIKYPLNYPNAKGYVNGKKVDNFQKAQIHPDDSLVVFIGDNNDIQKGLALAVKKTYIETVAKKSGDCGS